METKPTFRIITRRLQETTANSFLLWEEDDLFSRNFRCRNKPYPYANG